MVDEELRELLLRIAQAQLKTDVQLAETDKKLKELAENITKTDVQLAETDKKLKELIESGKMVDERLNRLTEKMDKTEAKINKLAEMYGGTSNNQGKVAEEFFYNSLKHRPIINGIQFDFVQKNVTRSLGNLEEEYDLILVNETIVFLIEVKYRLHKKDIEYYMEKKFPKFLSLFPEYKNHKIYVAFASFCVEEELKEQALQQGITILQRRGKVFEALAA